MRAFLLSSIFVAAAAAFAPCASTPRLSSRSGQQLNPLAMSTVGEDLPLVITGDNIQLTDAIVDHANKRVGGQVKKLAKSGAIRQCTLHLSVSKNPKVSDSKRAEVVVNVKGTTIVVTHESPDMYTSVDAAAHALHRRLCKYKERRLEGWHGGENMGTDIMEALDTLEDTSDFSGDFEEEDNIDPDKPVVTSVKSFDLENAITLDEAVFALDYVDHDFYVFKNKATDKINVVYKRHVGGVGHIE